MDNQNPLLAFVPMLAMSLPISFLCYKLSKQKGKNASTNLLLGLVPIINYFLLVYLVGAKDTLLDAKLDKVLSLLEQKS